ncbi:Ribosomal protein S18 acetylase RimI [Algoriphagus hitonicola]|uniref:Ribosomal protein S18 acetylase RimI n=2 Tax=Algoriphagus hitonicola TaxID=435880 RepID=A0A1I2WLI7_9BACT|nr:Ribosomal protein S18 acetylase RimI [Algoriphagus hitonicola]
MSPFGTIHFAWINRRFLNFLHRKENHVSEFKVNERMKFRKATRKDVAIIVEMLADDELGKTRENFQIPLPAEYLAAFVKINADPNQELIVVEDENAEVIGTLQLSFIQYLTYQGGIRAQIEAVRIKKDRRGIGIGKAMFEWAINRAKERNAHLLQLTTDKKRPEAIKFYESLGFNPSHEGMKITLKNNH